MKNQTVRTISNRERGIHIKLKIYLHSLWGVKQHIIMAEHSLKKILLMLTDYIGTIDLL
jgi:hypothetical protein